MIGTNFGLMPIDDLGRASRAAVFAACERSLRRSRTDWIDLYYLHSPDSSVPVERKIEESALAECQRLGLGVIPYYPQAAGLLIGKCRAEQTPTVGRLLNPHFIELANKGIEPSATPENLAKVERLLVLASSRGLALLERFPGWRRNRRCPR